MHGKFAQRCAVPKDALRFFKVFVGFSELAQP